MATITGAHIGCSPTWGAGKRSDGTIAVLLGLLFSPLPLRAQSRDGLRLVSAVEVDRVCVCVFVWLFVCAATWFVCMRGSAVQAEKEAAAKARTRLKAHLRRQIVFRSARFHRLLFQAVLCVRYSSVTLAGPAGACKLAIFAIVVPSFGPSDQPGFYELGVARCYAVMLCTLALRCAFRRQRACTGNPVGPSRRRCSAA